MLQNIYLYIFLHLHFILLNEQANFSRTSMARISLGPWNEFVRDTSSSSHWGLIIAPDQESNSDNSGNIFRFSKQ